MANSVLYGVLSLKDLAADLTPQNTVVTIDRDLLIGAVIQTISQHNAEINSIREIFANTTTNYTLNYKTAANNTLQEGDEYSKPEPVKGGGYYGVGFPIRKGEDSWGANYTALQRMNLQDFSDRTDDMLTGDVNWMRKWMFGTILYDGNNGSGAPGTLPYTFNDPEFGPISIYGLANGDSTVYDKVGGAGTDNHYSSQNGAISDTSGQNPFPQTIENELLEHPSNTGDVICYVAPDLVPSIQGLANFVVPSTLLVITPGSTTPTLVSGPPANLIPPNAKFIGAVGRCYIVEWRTVPAGHIISRPTGQVRPALLFREFPEASLKGFAPIDFANGNFGNKFPYFEEIWQRWGGFGSYNRVGMQVHQVTSSTTYQMSSTYYKQFGRTS